MKEPAAQTVGGRKGRSRRFALTAGVCAGIVVGMVGLAYAAVPLYQIFCAVTGFGGTTMRAEAPKGAPIDRMITVRFDANVGTGLPWRFEPEARSIRIRMGEVAEIAYLAKNLGLSATTAAASFNVTPPQVGGYFNKISCFCFTDQTLEAGQEVEMPVVLFVDPAMDEDENLRYVDSITLSYTFFPQAGPSVAAAATGEAAAGGA